MPETYCLFSVFLSSVHFLPFLFLFCYLFNLASYVCFSHSAMLLIFLYIHSNNFCFSILISFTYDEWNYLVDEKGYKYNYLNTVYSFVLLRSFLRVYLIVSESYIITWKVAKIKCDKRSNKWKLSNYTLIFWINHIVYENNKTNFYIIYVHWWFEVETHGKTKKYK